MAYNQNNQQQNGGRPMTTTHIRTLFAQNVASMTIKFFNTNLSIQMMPYGGKDNRGRDNYDKNRSLMTTINFEGAAALQIFAADAIAGKLTTDKSVQEIPCNQATLMIVRTRDPSPQAGKPFTTELMLNKNGQSISFPFTSVVRSIIKDGQPATEIVETGLKTFGSIMEGYLSGINADRHLDKLTDEFAKAQEAKQAAGGGSGGWSGGGGGGYQKSGGYGGGAPTGSQPVVDFNQFAIPG